MFSIPQSTSFVLVFKAYLSSDHVTEATGKTIAITISKAGGAFGNPNAGATNATEISSGWYKVTLDATDTGTLGIIAIRGAAATIDDFGDRMYVVKATNGGLTALPDTAVTTNASLLTSGTGTAQLSVASGLVTLAASQPGVTIPTVTTVTNQLTSAAIATGVWTDTTAGDFTTALSVGKSVMNGVSLGTGLTVNAVTGLTASNLDAAVSSRMATYSQPTGFLAATFPTTVASPTNITSITGNITGNLSGSVGSVTGAVGSVTGAVGSVTGNVGGNVVGSVASVTARVTANSDQIAGDATAATNLKLSTDAICRGTVGSSSSTTSIITSAFAPGVGAAGQFIGRTVIFDAATSTTALQGQATNITNSTNSATPTLTVTALTTAPVSGDTFSIV